MCDHNHDIPEEGTFDDANISRRQFVRLSAATGGVLALPGAATASAESSAFDAEYQYLLNHTPEEYRVPTLIKFTDVSGVASLDALGLGEKLHTTAEPRPAAYAQLTATEAETVAEIPTAEELSYTPGSNPFWRLDYYPFGVFPAVERSVDFIHYEQMMSGMDHLQEEHPDQLKYYALADQDNPHEVQFDKSPGHRNNLTTRVDPKDIHIAELTNPPEGFDTVEEYRNADPEDLPDGVESFEERQKVMYEASIHGLERAGPESCFRFIERILTGREPHFEQLLDDCVLIILSVNPDGWVARDPQYDSAWQLLDSERDGPRLPAWPQYERGNSMVFDTNRQYPTIGWIDPNHHPGEPDRSRWAEDNPHDIIDMVPDAMGTVEHFRQYSNLTHGADLHAMLNNSDFILGLINQIEFTQDEFHDLYEMNLVLEESLEEELDEWEAIADLQEAVTGDFNIDAGFPVLPETAYDFSTIWDTIGYTITGGLIGFMGADEERGGLDMTTMAFEMAFSHMIGGNVFEPVLADMWVEGYLEAMRTMTEYALRDVESDLTTRSGDHETVAYVGSETITRSSEDLDFGGDEAETELDSFAHTLELDGGALEADSIEVTEGTHSLSIHPHAEQALLDVVLRNPDGEVVRSYRPSETNGEAHHDYPPMVVTEPTAGEWTVEMESLMNTPTQVSLDIATLDTNGAEHPDPRDAMGFAQEDYEVTPLQFFEDFDNDNTAIETVELSPGEVADGVDADHLVIIHDDVGDADEDDYIDEIDAFVEDGGNLILTDSGMKLLEAMETAPAVENGDVRQIFQDVPHLEEKDTDHPLLTDTRDIQQMPYKIAPLGIPYASDAPLWVVDNDGWESSGGTVAGTSDSDVSAGSLFTDDEDWQGIHVLGGLLPPAQQDVLHPFGLKNYVLAYFGLTIFTNAMGAQQERIVDSEHVRSVGDADQPPAVGSPTDPVGELTAEGSRETDSGLVTGGQTTEVRVTVEELEGDADTVELRDEFPEEWTLFERSSDGELHEDGVISFGNVDVEDFEETTFRYFIQAPEGIENSNQYEVGPAVAIAADAEDEFAESEDVLLVGASV